MFFFLFTVVCFAERPFSWSIDLFILIATGCAFRIHTSVIAALQDEISPPQLKKKSMVAEQRMLSRSLFSSPKILHIILWVTHYCAWFSFNIHWRTCDSLRLLYSCSVHHKPWLKGLKALICFLIRQDKMTSCPSAPQRKNTGRPHRSFSRVSHLKTPPLLLLLWGLFGCWSR